jgi:hypothetical protein
MDYETFSHSSITHIRTQVILVLYMFPLQRTVTHLVFFNYPPRDPLRDHLINVVVHTLTTLLTLRTSRCLILLLIH